MKDYIVSVTAHAEECIEAYERFIWQQSQEWTIANRWTVQVYKAISSLHYSPRRFSLAEEDRLRDYEIRRLVIGNYVALYTILDDIKNDDVGRVVVIGFRHASRLPQTQYLPKTLS